MKYMGSKSRIAKEIVPIIQGYIDIQGIKTYIEPFCGGCNIIDKILCDTKRGYDKQKYLIALLQNLDKLDSLPNFITKEEYSAVRTCYNNNQDNYEDWYIGAIGFLASYNGRFFDGGYAGIRTEKNGKERNYFNEAKRNLIKQSENLKDVIFKCSDFKDLDGFKDCMIYCDPPYFGTKQYNVSRNFDYDYFWEWVRKMSEHNIVLVSEQTGPSDFEVVWEQNIKRTLDYSKKLVVTEKLFKYKKAP